MNHTMGLKYEAPIRLFDHHTVFSTFRVIDVEDIVDEGKS